MTWSVTFGKFLLDERILDLLLLKNNQLPVNPLHISLHHRSLPLSIFL